MISKSDSTRIKCRGSSIDIYPVKGSESISRAYFKNAIMYLTNYEPVSIIYKDEGEKPIMTFRKIGDVSVSDKIKLRKAKDYKTVMPNVFDGAVFDLLSEHNHG